MGDRIELVDCFFQHSGNGLRIDGSDGPLYVTDVKGYCSIHEIGPCVCPYCKQPCTQELYDFIMGSASTVGESRE